MSLSGFIVRKFRSAALERAFRVDYAQRYAGQRRIAGAVSLLLWVFFTRRDWWLLTQVAPDILPRVVLLRGAGIVGMAVPVFLLWGVRAFNERWVVGLLGVWLVSSWATLLTLMELYPAPLAFREIFPEFLLVLFTIFTLLRLRAITAAWLVGLCAVSFHLTLFLWPRDGAQHIGAGWASRGSVLSIMYVAGVIFCVQFELAARREFMFRRTLRAARIRAERASRLIARQNERMKEVLAEKERFFSAAYHDIQQPLAAINLFIRSARSRLADGTDAVQDLAVVEQTALDTLAMFKGVQEYSELGAYAPSLSSVAIQDIVREIVDQYHDAARARGLRLVVSARERPPPHIETDRSLLKRALSNLVSNALKNTLAGGVVVGWVDLGQELRIDVWDTGVGIASSHREAIFTEYYQINNPARDRSKGLGLGLSIVQRIIGILPKHRMRFASVEGRGSRFCLYVPVSGMTPILVSEQHDEPVRQSALEGSYILLCDDDPIILEGLRRLFVSAGALVDTAASLSDIEGVLTPEGRVPDLIVMDIRLGDGPNGVQVAAQVRQHYAWAGALPVAFITGELFSPRLIQDFAAPFVLLRKSSAPERTLADVSHFLSRERRKASDLAPAP
ncbi:hybrid sensor histidine kinase/response regulator [Paraburkholderia sp. DHOC27]|uniref:hybrid sensor histidine kinase/response regulator n=1 Tax=Paraburkholderia sp. DHOC27 TaxID=2303330 RepID=UPI000E3E7B60|nr:hybrid sensor histidine kinase/response regulator [Paraburkholderia sp. DHOC27]RFU49709.1 response regulator [Paraburkholderia sp. DHOC27]